MGAPSKPLAAAALDPAGDEETAKALVGAFHCATWPGVGDRDTAVGIASHLARLDAVKAKDLVDFWWGETVS